MKTFSRSSTLLLAATALAGCAAGSVSPSVQAASAPATQDREFGDASVYGLFLAGEAAIDRGSSRDAAFYFARASALDPSSESLRSRAFTSALVAGDVSGAARLADGLTDPQSPVSGLARLTLAVDDLADGRGREALTVLSGPPPPAPYAAATALLKPWAALKAGDAALAEAIPATGSNSVLASIAALGRAEILEREGKLDQAEAAFKAHATAKNGLFVLGYGGFLERRRRYQEAVAVYEKALAAKPDDIAFARAKARAVARGAAPPTPTVAEGAAEALIAPAVLMLAEHQGDSGLGYLRLALRLDPRLDEAWVLVGDSMTNAGDPRGDLALALQKDGDKEGALSLVRETLKSSPADPRLLTLYADLLSEDDRYEDAATAMTDAIKAVGDSKAGWSLFYLRGASEERAGRWPAAEADLKRALALNPDEPEVMNYLGYAWVDRGEHLPEALSLLEKAEAKEPDSGAIVDSLGWARYRTHDYASAIIDLERAIQLDPSDPEVNDHLGDVYWRVGRRLEAQYQWRRVLTLEPDSKTRTEVEAKIKDGLPPDAPEQVARKDLDPKTPYQP
jgi:tetratricopeptide (TPR) repeat protein